MSAVETSFTLIVLDFAISVASINGPRDESNVRGFLNKLGVNYAFCQKSQAKLGFDIKVFCGIWGKSPKTVHVTRPLHANYGALNVRKQDERDNCG